VRGLLDRLKADPAVRIDSIADANAIAAMGGNPQASYYINLGKGALAGGFKDAPVGLSRPARSKGMHGYFPAAATMRSSFMLMGKSIPAGRNLGEIDMRAIAPTLARILKVSFPTAELPPVSFAP
jgi:predicted AlkP superfamily pyrophosphatase or phosphodiesterase